MKHVPHLYVPGDWAPGRLSLTDAQERHLTKVLRIGKGGPVTYSDGKGGFGSGTWSAGSIRRGEETTVPRPTHLVLAVAPPSNRDRTRFMVEKLSELGVMSLRWLTTRWGSGRAPKPEKQAAWAIAGLEQSRGAWLMRVEDRMVMWGDLDEPIGVFAPGGTDTDPLTIRTFVVGPEGGLDPEEIPANSREFDLGPTILRVETAAIVAAATFRKGK